MAARDRRERGQETYVGEGVSSNREPIRSDILLESGLTGWLKPITRIFVII